MRGGGRTSMLAVAVAVVVVVCVQEDFQSEE